MGSNVSSQFKQIFARKNKEIQSISAQIERARMSGKEEKHKIYLESDSINSFDVMKQVCIRFCIWFWCGNLKLKFVKVEIIFLELFCCFSFIFHLLLFLDNFCFENINVVNDYRDIFMFIHLLKIRIEKFITFLLVYRLMIWFSLSKQDRTL